MQRYKVVVVCCTADETDVHTIRVNGWGGEGVRAGSPEKLADPPPILSEDNGRRAMHRT